VIKKLFNQHFAREPEFSAVAPGRLEFIGNHTDYNGGPVLGVSVDRRVSVAVARRSDRTLRLWSGSLRREVIAELDTLEPLVGDRSWANYSLGVLDELIKAGMAAPFGFDLAVDSDLPAGAGMSSSAAFELASAYALAALYDFQFGREDMARLCRRAENQFVGVPCGILDQGVSAFGEENALVMIDCREESFRKTPLPAGINFWVFNTAKKHALLDSLYATRHRECMEALARLKKEFPDLACLAQLSLAQLEESRILLDRVHYHRAHHVISECARVKAVELALEENDVAEVGRLLYASHASSRDDFENSIPELDFLVDQLHEDDSVWGARLTGGGFGGAVMAVTTDDFDQAAAESVARAYLERFGQPASVFHTRTGPGVSLLQ